MGGRKEYLDGVRVGRLIAIREVEPDKARNRMYECRCDCGKIVNVRVSWLSLWKTLSCGCLAAELSAKRKYRHGKTKTNEYGIWNGMKQRCRDPKGHAYHNYGGRGIKVCDRWNSFENFLKDMGPRPSINHSIDRIDVNGDYEPGNCRWATIKEQAENTRRAIRCRERGKK